MCEPVSLMMAAGTLISMVGQVKAGMDQKKMANYQARVADVNAQNALAIGASEEERIRREGRRVRQNQKAQIAAAGLDVTAGSPLLLQVNAAEETELAALDARLSGQMTADQQTRDAAVRRAEGKLAFTNALFGAASTAFKGGGSVGQRGGFDGLFQPSGGIQNSGLVWPGV